MGDGLLGQRRGRELGWALSRWGAQVDMGGNAHQCRADRRLYRHVCVDSQLSKGRVQTGKLLTALVLLVTGMCGTAAWALSSRLNLSLRFVLFFASVDLETAGCVGARPLGVNVCQWRVGAHRLP